MDNECFRCGESLVNAQCPQCHGKEFCERCDIHEAQEQCRTCLAIVCLDPDCSYEDEGGDVRCTKHEDDADEWADFKRKEMREERHG